MAIQYKTIDVSTLKGLKQAERLHTSGWKMARSGMFTIQFYRDKPKASSPAQAESLISDQRKI